ncbi:hypothetical protein ACPV5Q_07805 [Vibrio astriarenae]
MRVNRIAVALGLTSAIVMVGCDGGSSSSSTNPSPTSTTYSVKAIDGYLRNAKVWLDINRDFLHDEGTEPSAVTGEGGVADLDVSGIENYQDYQLVVHAIAGETIDEDTIDEANPTGQVMQGSMVLSAPAGESNITPLSSFVNLLINKKPNALDDPEQREQLKQQAVNEAANQLGLNPDTLLDDYLEEGEEDAKAAFAAQSIVQSEQVLPETPEEMADLAQDVQSAGESASEDVPELKIAEAINEQIKQVVESTAEEDLATTPPPVEPPSDDTPSADDDADGVPNHLDEFPNKSNEWLDSDDDGMGNNQDAFDFDPTEQYDNDSDGTGDNADLDDDNDTFLDDVDQFPFDMTKAGDHDSDGVDSVDDPFPYDHDNDGYNDDVDLFDDDPTEWADNDTDGIGDNADLDDDNDTFLDDVDEFPLDSTKAGDPDNDGIDSVTDTHPYDHDNDGYDDDVDLFDDDPTEWADNDTDGIGDNADLDDDNDGIDDEDDLHPFDETLAGDPDNDGVDTLVDAYPNDPEKSVADQVTQNSDFMPVLNINHRQVLKLNVDVEQRIETFNDNTVTITLTTRYLSEEGVEYGYTQSIDIASGTDFTRIVDFRFDFNLDGDAQFVGRTLDIGTRESGIESYWRYVDESDASDEGGVNGSARVFHNFDFSARVHPSDLSEIDTVQSFTVTYEEVEGNDLYTTNMTQFDVAGFDYTDVGTQVANYASINRTTIADLLQVGVEDSQDWEADGSINTVLLLGVGENGEYGTGYMMPVWANPQDGVYEEYADFNFTPGNWDNLTSYWYEYLREYKADGSVVEQGWRFVLDDTTNTKLTVGDDPSGLMFHKWDQTSRVVSDSERNEHVTWTHYALDGYDFTAASEDTGQAYRIYTHQVDDIWTTLSFDEWGSTDVVNLADQIENARAGGTSMYDIDASVVAGLDRYAASLPNSTFQYQENGAPRTWYAVTQDPRMTDGTPTVVPISLSEDGVMPNSYVASNGPELILIAAMDENNIYPWFDAYYRQRIEMYDLNMDLNHFDWTTNIGQLFINLEDAQARLDEVLNPAYMVCSHQNTGEKANPADSFDDFLPAAYQCGYIGIDESYLDGLTLYYQEDAENYLSYQFNTDGSGTYYESNGYTDSITWSITNTGIISIDNGGDAEHFAYIADQDGQYSLLGFFEWDEDGTPYSEIFGMEMTSYLPTGYKVCTQGDTEWDEVNDRPASSPQYADLQQAVSDCGGAIPMTTEMMNGLVWHDYNPDRDYHKIWTFYADGTVMKTKNGVESGPFTWFIDANGYLNIEYDQGNPDDFIILALIATQGDQYSLKALDSYPEEVDGQTEIWTEIVTEDFVTTNPVDKSGVIAALTTHVNWFSPWAEWNEEDQKDYLYFDHLDITQADVLTWTRSSVVELNKTLSAIDISDDFDLMLTTDGWEKVTGFEFDLSNSDIVGASPVAPSLTYSIIYAAVHDKQGSNIEAEAPGDWTHYLNNTEVYPSGSQVVAVTMRNDEDSYYLLDWRPYHMLAEPGVDNDGDQVSSLDELFVTTGAGDGVQGDLLDSASIGHEVSVELVRPLSTDTTGVANFYTVDWHVNNIATLLATGSWELRNLNGEQLVLFEIPQTVIDSFGNVIDSNWMFYSVYRSATGGDDVVHVGQFFHARSERDEIYMFNGTAKDAIINAADIQ